MKVNKTFRTLKYILREPWGYYKIVTEYHNWVTAVKSYVITNWIQDIQNSPVDPHIKKYFFDLIKERSGFSKEDK
jgi:hypothetical protein